MSQKIRIVVHRLCLICSLLFVTVGCDQATKLVVRDSLPITGPLSYLNGSIQLEYAQNPGAFLSLGAALPVNFRFWFFGVICGLFLMVVAIVLFKDKKLRPLSIVGLTLLLGGGIGNLIDRFLFGHVTDFLFIHFGPLKTGIFNFADVAIVGGVAILTLLPLFGRKRSLVLR